MFELILPLNVLLFKLLKRFLKFLDVFLEGVIEEFEFLDFLLEVSVLLMEFVALLMELSIFLMEFIVLVDDGSFLDEDLLLN